MHFRKSFYSNLNSLRRWQWENRTVLLNYGKSYVLSFDTKFSARNPSEQHINESCLTFKQKNSLSNQIFLHIAKLFFSRYIIREAFLNELHVSHCSQNPSKTDLHTVKTVFLIELDWTVWQIAYYLYLT